MHLFGGVSVRAGIAHRSVDDDGGRQAAPDVACEVGGAFRRINARSKAGARLFEERLRGHGLRGVGREIVAHQLEEGVVAHLVAQRIEKQNALRLAPGENGSAGLSGPVPDRAK